MKAILSDTVAKLVQKYETRIHELETENSNLKKDLVTLRGTAPVATTASSTAITTVKPTNSGTLLAPSGTKADIYALVIKQSNAGLSTILSENNLSSGSVIGLFEFIEPNAVFLSIDDGNNPTGVTAFKTKILYTFDDTATFTKIGLFDLDYASQKYRTVFGSNPYTKSVRVRMENPSYKGKLFDLPKSSSGSTISASTAATGSTVVSEVTLAQIKTTYEKSKLLDAIKLSDVYIVKNPNDLDVLRIRYRSYYIIGKYENSLAEIKKIETLQGSAFERTIACDAAVIGKIAKKTDISTYYSTICKKK